jgi:hypothetical protein
VVKSYTKENSFIIVLFKGGLYIMSNIDEVKNYESQDIISDSSSNKDSTSIKETSENTNINTGQIESDTEETANGESDNRTRETGYNNTTTANEEGGKVIDNNTEENTINDRMVNGSTKNITTTLFGSISTTGKEENTEENDIQQTDDDVENGSINSGSIDNDISSETDSGSGDGNTGGQEENQGTGENSTTGTDNTGENVEHNSDSDPLLDPTDNTDGDDDPDSSDDSDDDSGEDEELYPGKEIRIKNTDIYMRWFSKTPQFTRSGTYYIYDEKEKNGRIRICGSIDACSVNGRVTGWVNIEDIIDNKSIKVGDKVVVSGNITVMADGTGNKILKNEEIMYVCDILEDKEQFPNYIGVSSSFTSGRQGWGNDEIISKYVNTDVVHHE